VPATASGTRMKPPCATDEYANIRTMLVWRIATRLPIVMDAAASTHRTGSHDLPDSKKPKRTIVSRATNPPAFDATDRNAVTGVGAPSYVSGAQKWNGTALILNANPTSVRKIATANNGGRSGREAYAPILLRSVEPDSPKMNDMPYSITADDNTPKR